jgi:hypothetical protein
MNERSYQAASALIVVLASCSAAACSSNASGGFGNLGVDSGTSGQTGGDGGASPPTPEASVLTQSDASSPGADGSSSGTAIVYGQSASTLYAVNPDTKAVAKVADFKGCGDEVIDLALDKDSNMYATTTDGVYTVDRTTGQCHQLASGDYPNSLSFVPAGTLDPNVEALVGYSGSTYVRIDTTTGALTNVGEIGKGYASSGDIVSVIGGGTYLTVTDNDACFDSDCLIEVNPKTGALVTDYGPLGYSNVFGLAFWAGTVYGFDDKGDLFQVTFTQGMAKVTTIPIPDAPSNLSFYGAGSTTSAPPTAVTK